jgi:hypothetical protein
MLCARCGEDNVFSKERRARFAEKAGLSPPPLPPDICLACALKDPVLQEKLRPWFEEMKVWSDQRMQEYVRRLRALAVRPLEAIDRFVESFR